MLSIHLNEQYQSNPIIPPNFLAKTDTNLGTHYLAIPNGEQRGSIHPSRMDTSTSYTWIEGICEGIPVRPTTTWVDLSWGMCPDPSSPTFPGLASGQITMVIVSPRFLGIVPLPNGHSWLTLQETNISPKNAILKMILLFPRWDMLVPWRVYKGVILTTY